MVGITTRCFQGDWMRLVRRCVALHWLRTGLDDVAHTHAAPSSPQVAQLHLSKLQSQRMCQLTTFNWHLGTTCYPKKDWETLSDHVISTLLNTSQHVNSFVVFCVRHFCDVLILPKDWDIWTKGRKPQHWRVLASCDIPSLPFEHLWWHHVV